MTPSKRYKEALESRKMLERVYVETKERVFEYYSRIVWDFKDYEKITRQKMIEEVYEIYSDYRNIVEICTTRELKYLEKILKHGNDMEVPLDTTEEEWELRALREKFLICDNFETVFIPEEIVEVVREALKKVDWEKKKKYDFIDELLVGYCKMQGSGLFNALCMFVASVIEEDEEIVQRYALANRLFAFYVCVHEKNVGGSIGRTLVAVHYDYYEIEEEIAKERKRQGIAPSMKLDLDLYRVLFYNDFDVRNAKIKKFLKELNELPILTSSVLETVREYAMLNKERKSLEKMIAQIPVLKDRDLTKFFKTMNAAMDEMPSGVLNGATPKEARVERKEDMRLIWEVDY